MNALATEASTSLINSMSLWCGTHVAKVTQMACYTLKECSSCLNFGLLTCTQPVVDSNHECVHPVD